LVPSADDATEAQRLAGAVVGVQVWAVALTHIMVVTIAPNCMLIREMRSKLVEDVFDFLFGDDRWGFKAELFTWFLSMLLVYGAFSLGQVEPEGKGAVVVSSF